MAGETLLLLVLFLAFRKESVVNGRARVHGHANGRVVSVLFDAVWLFACANWIEF